MAEQVLGIVVGTAVQGLDFVCEAHDEEIERGEAAAFGR